MNPIPTPHSRPRAARALRAWAAGALAAALSAAPLAGCMAMEAGTSDDPRVDPFPKPIGEAFLPLDGDFHARYRYAEFDSAGNVLLREDLPLHVFPKPGGLFAYAFESDARGLLLQLRDGDGNRDSAGVYIVGRFRDSSVFLDSAAALWLPQFPRTGVSWPLSPTRRTEVASLDTAFWTEALAGMYADTATVLSAGLQRHPTILFKETAGDTVTFYHFRRGLGCVAFQRAARGKLIAAGSLFSIYRYRVSALD
jgi:hypothetical protein